MKRNQKGFTLVEIMIVVVIIGLLAVMAIPAFNKVRATAQKNAITNNLRQIASAADQYFVQAGLTTAAYADLVGPTQYIKALTPVANENYSAIFPVTEGFTQLSITCASLTAPVVYAQ
jgi:type IV pilus assembly protein PilA